VSGKQSKKEKKAAREAQREALRKQERQRTVFTLIVIVVVIAVGGVLIVVSLEDPTPEDELADLLGDDADDDADADGAEDVADPDEVPEDVPEEVEAVADRPVACGAEEPAGAGEERPTFEEPEQVLEDGIDYVAVIETSCGTVTIDLDEERAPEAVNSFVFLAEQGFFDGQLVFRNATSISALQTGAGTDDATWQVGYQLDDELETAEEEGYPAGTVAMANSGPDTAGSQFFMVYGDGFQEGVEAGALQPTYTRFGTVTEGLDVLEEIGAVEVDGESPLERIYLETVTISTS
jgi:peptidyl-prolyl cis-trans isomerase B (cyclophilin B)